MEDALAAADLIICRAGATTLAEITAKGVPAILVPYPFAAENHQEYNARALESRGAALVIKDSELTGELLASKIRELLSNGEHLRSMGQASKDMGRPEALNMILQCMEEIMH
jgi:UDP-N-acetylglucosamine--N-acetylmuramyl-(pentapeptide) pyrophosphoryl-undecaprenol N-acetylglucosamine transferase